MIALISGKIAGKHISNVVIDVQGVGYRVFIPLTTFYELPETGQQITLYVHTSVKEDAINLYGFYTTQERDIFQLLISVNGIGPKMGMNILSGIPTQELLQAICDGNVGKLTRIPGVGKKMAERLVLELKEKVAKQMMTEEAPGVAAQNRVDDMIAEDVLSALVNLGYKNNVAKDALDKAIRQSGGEMAMDQLLKTALKILAG